MGFFVAIVNSWIYEFFIFKMWLTPSCLKTYNMPCFFSNSYGILLMLFAIKFSMFQVF